MGRAWEYPAPKVKNVTPPANPSKKVLKREQPGLGGTYDSSKGKKGSNPGNT